MKKQIIAVGKTYPFKEELKAMGAKWDGNNWSFEEMPTETIDGITFEIIVKTTDENKIAEAVEGLRKAYLPTAIANVEYLAKVNNKTVEQVKVDGTSAQHVKFKQYAIDHFEIFRPDFENFRAFKEFKNKVIAEIEKVATVESFWSNNEISRY